MGALAIVFGIVIYFILTAKDTFEEEQAKSRDRAKAIAEGRKYYWGKTTTYSVKTNRPCSTEMRRDGQKGYEVVDLKTRRKVDDFIET